MLAKELEQLVWVLPSLGLILFFPHFIISFVHRHILLQYLAKILNFLKIFYCLMPQYDYWTQSRSHTHFSEPFRNTASDSLLYSQEWLCEPPAQKLGIC